MPWLSTSIRAGGRTVCGFFLLCTLKELKFGTQCAKFGLLIFDGGDNCSTPRKARILSTMRSSEVAVQSLKVIGQDYSRIALGIRGDVAIVDVHHVRRFD
jgi:hypothetical protein